MRRLRRTAQVAFHCLRVVLNGPVAVPTLGEVKRRTVLPLLQLCCVELVCKQLTVAIAAFVQNLFPCLFLSIATTIRHLGTASVACRILCDIPVPSPHIDTVGIERRACQCFAADDTLHFGVLVGGVRPVNSGPTSFVAFRTSVPFYTPLFYSATEECWNWR